MNKVIAIILGMMLLTTIACRQDDFDRDIEIPDFNFKKTITFEEKLSSYHIFEGTPSLLQPASNFELLELSSILFTDYAYKQRLMKIPDGTQVSKLSDGTLDFPNGTILVKTFFYYADERDTSLGKNIIETRLLIKEADFWNAATYLWNQDQTEATLKLDGHDTPVSWVNKTGNTLSTLYHVPTENECMTCHQKNDKMMPLGPTLVNLNKTVEREGSQVNQLSYLQNKGLMQSFPLNHIPIMVDYFNTNESIEDRAKAYLAMNCAHCHSPNSWERAAEREFDFRFETPIAQMGVHYEEEKIKRALKDQEMPLIGTTMLDEEGIQLVIDFVDNLE